MFRFFIPSALSRLRNIQHRIVPFVNMANFTLQQNDAAGKEAISGDLFNIFSDFLNVESSTSAAKAAQAVSKLAPTLKDGSKSLEDGFFFSLWKDVIRIAEQIPHDHPAMDKLVKFMRELTLLPDTGLQVWDVSPAHPSPREQEAMTNKTPKTRLWTELPVFSAVCREHLNGPGTSKDAEEQAQIDKRWVRFHAFSARLFGAGVVDSTNQIIWMLRDALEEDTGKKSASARDRDLSVAAAYIEYAGPLLAEAVVRTPTPSLSKEDERLLRGGPLYSGPAGLQSERWLFWLRRFREVAEGAAGEDAKALALRSARLMEIWVERRLRPRE